MKLMQENRDMMEGGGEMQDKIWQCECKCKRKVGKHQMSNGVGEKVHRQRVNTRRSTTGQGG